jgi:hypothetical protein
MVKFAPPPQPVLLGKLRSCGLEAYFPEPFQMI